MGRLAVILGSNGLGPGGENVATAVVGRGALLLQRHDRGGEFTLPHRIDHVTNLKSLAGEGCDRVLAVASVGSLRADLGVGSFVCPHDFVALHLGLTALTDMSAHRVPGFDPAWRARLLGAWETAGGAELQDGGVYWQTIGPRFETPAEIALIAAHADVVGMTVASECVVAGELGLAYAAVCVVDNLANGLDPDPLSVEALEARRADNVVRLAEALDAVLPALADG